MSTFSKDCTQSFINETPERFLTCFIVSKHSESSILFYFLNNSGAFQKGRTQSKTAFSSGIS